MTAYKGFGAEQYGQDINIDGTGSYVVSATGNPLEQRAGDRMSRLPLSSLANSDTITYLAFNLDDATQWETGLGTYTSATFTLARTTVYLSSNSNNAVDWTPKGGGAGAARVRILGMRGLATLTAATYTAITSTMHASQAANGAFETIQDTMSGDRSNQIANNILEVYTQLVALAADVATIRTNLTAAGLMADA